MESNLCRRKKGHRMKFRRLALLLVAAMVVVTGFYGVRILLHGFTTAAAPSRLQ